MVESSVGEFFEQNSHLFTVLGVFGAVSVYFTQLELSSQWRRLGIVSSLSIFLLISIVIQRNITPKNSEKAPFDFIIAIQRQKLGFVMFYVAFYAVVLSVVAIVIQYSGTFIFMVQFLCFLVGVGIVRFWIKEAYGGGEISLVPGEEDDFAYIISKILRNAIHMFVIGFGTLSILWIRDMVPVDQLIEFQMESLL